MDSTEKSMDTDSALSRWNDLLVIKNDIVMATIKTFWAILK